MAKRKKKSNKARSTSESEAKQLQQTYYCEYLCYDEYWWLQVANPRPGYYCPADPAIPLCKQSNEGETRRIPDGVPEDIELQGELTPSKTGCRYLYSKKHGTFLLQGGNVDEKTGKSAEPDYCPTDLLAFLFEHWPSLGYELESAGHDGVITEVTMNPRSVIACRKDTPPHGPDHHEGFSA